MTKGEDLAKLRREFLDENRGSKKKAPAEVSELKKLQKRGASVAYVRLSALAQSVTLKKQNPVAYISLNQWLYEVVHGKPKVAMEGKIDVPIQITYRLVERPEIEQEGIKELEEGKIESSSEDRSRDITEPIEID